MLLWADLVQALDVPAGLDTEQAQIAELQTRRRENLEDIQAARVQASKVGSSAGHLRYITACREEIALCEQYLDSLDAPHEADDAAGVSRRV